MKERGNYQTKYMNNDAWRKARNSVFNKAGRHANKLTEESIIEKLQNMVVSKESRSDIDDNEYGSPDFYDVTNPYPTGTDKLVLSNVKSCVDMRTRGKSKLGVRR